MGAIRAGAIRRWWSRRVERKQRDGLMADATKAAIALDIMLADKPWYGGVRVVEEPKPLIEVQIVDDFPGKLSDFIPPRVGVVPVLVRFGTKA